MYNNIYIYIYMYRCVYIYIYIQKYVVQIPWLSARCAVPATHATNATSSGILTRLERKRDVRVGFDVVCNIIQSDITSCIVTWHVCLVHTYNICEHVQAEVAQVPLAIIME